MDKETEAQLTAIRRQLATLCEEMQFLRKHRNVLSGTLFWSSTRCVRCSARAPVPCVVCARRASS